MTRPACTATCHACAEAHAEALYRRTRMRRDLFECAVALAAFAAVLLLGPRC